MNNHLENIRRNVKRKAPGIIDSKDEWGVGRAVKAYRLVKVAREKPREYNQLIDKISRCFYELDCLTKPQEKNKCRR